MVRFVSLSSTTSARVPAKSTEGAGVASASARSTGTVNQKRLPLPGVLSTPILPPISCTSSFEIARPRPVPPKRRVVEVSACENGSNSVGSASGSMPMPVSATSKRSTAAPSSPARSTAACATISPSSVNFRALPSRLVST